MDTCVTAELDSRYLSMHYPQKVFMLRATWSGTDARFQVTCGELAVSQPSYPYGHFGSPEVWESCRYHPRLSSGCRAYCKVQFSEHEVYTQFFSFMWQLGSIGNLSQYCSVREGFHTNYYYEVYISEFPDCKSKNAKNSISPAC